MNTYTEPAAPYPDATLANLANTVACAELSFKEGATPTFIRGPGDDVDVVWEVCSVDELGGEDPKSRDLSGLSAKADQTLWLCKSSDSAQFWGCEYLVGNDWNDGEIVGIKLAQGGALLVVVNPEMAQSVRDGTLTQDELCENYFSAALLRPAWLV